MPERFLAATGLDRLVLPLPNLRHFTIARPGIAKNMMLRACDHQFGNHTIRRRQAMLWAGETRETQRSNKDCEEEKKKIRRVWHGDPLPYYARCSRLSPCQTLRFRDVSVKPNRTRLSPTGSSGASGAAEAAAASDAPPAGPRSTRRACLLMSHRSWGGRALLACLLRVRSRFRSRRGQRRRKIGGLLLVAGRRGASFARCSTVSSILQCRKKGSACLGLLEKWRLLRGWCVSWGFGSCCCTLAHWRPDGGDRVWSSLV